MKFFVTGELIVRSDSELNSVSMRMEMINGWLVGWLNYI